MTMTFLVRSSRKPTPYHVLIEANGEAVGVHCDCEAGARGQCCKHKAAIILNQSAALFDASQAPDLARANVVLRNSQLFNTVRQVAEMEAETKGCVNGSRDNYLENRR